MREIDEILDKNEHVLWEGKPVFWPFFASSLFSLVIAVIFFLVLFLIASKNSADSTIFFLFILFLAPFYSAFVYHCNYYAVTDKRVLIQTGVIGRDFKTVDFNHITNTQVNVDLVDKLFNKGTGTITIRCRKLEYAAITHPMNGAFNLLYGTNSGPTGPMNGPYKLQAIQNPYEVFKLIKKRG